MVNPYQFLYVHNLPQLSEVKVLGLSNKVFEVSVSDHELPTFCPSEPLCLGLAF